MSPHRRLPKTMAVRQKTPSWPSTTGTLPTSAPVLTGSDGKRARDPFVAAEGEEDRPHGRRSDALPGDGLHRGDGPDNSGVRGHPLAVLGPPEVGGRDCRSHPRLPLPGLPGSRGRPRPSGPLAPGQNPVRGVRWVRPVSRLFRGALDHPAHERRTIATGGGDGRGRTGHLGFSGPIGGRIGCLGIEPHNPQIAEVNQGYTGTKISGLPAPVRPAGPRCPFLPRRW